MAKGKMNRKYTLGDRQGAFKMYLKGMNTREIAKEVNKHGSFDPPMAHTTVDRWVKKYGWDEERSTLEHEVMTETMEDAKLDMKNMIGEVEEVRQEFLDRMRGKSGADIRAHEFATLTKMQEQWVENEKEKEELIVHVTECIKKALDDTIEDNMLRQNFLLRYIKLLRGEE
jgi:transposase